MLTFRHASVVALMVSLPFSTPAVAQERHAVDRSTLARAVDSRVARQDAERAALREALGRPEVQRIAHEMGVDLNKVNASVATLAGGDLERAATAARQVNEALAGGASTVVISTTTLIIALLVVILLIVALK